jgi:hypothetical protein
MRESRTYGSGRGACNETHVPTATREDEAPRVHIAARRRRGAFAALAARGAGAACRDAGDRLPRERSAGSMGWPLGRLPSGPGPGWLRRGPQCCCRVPLVGGSIRPITGAGGRARSPSGRGDRRDWRNCSGAGGQGGDQHHSDRLRERRRSHRVWSRYEPEPTRWQCHGHQLARVHARGEAARAVARCGSKRRRYWRAGQSELSGCPKPK